MSILIKGIDMPKEGEHIIALIKTDGKVSYFEQDTKYGICKIMKEAEAIQIPTPHGRLIDWDAFNSKLDIQYAEGRGKALAPTILEAEE